MVSIQNRDWEGVVPIQNRVRAEQLLFRENLFTEKLEGNLEKIFEKIRRKFRENSKKLSKISRKLESNLKTNFNIC